MATTYWVDKTNPAADDNGPGSEAVPWYSISVGAADAIAGDTVLVGTGGVYDEIVDPINNGTDGSPITFAAITGGTTAIVRRFNLANASYITIKNFEITSDNAGITSDTNPSFIVTGSTRVRIEDCYIHDTDTTNDAAIRAFGAKCQYLYVGGNTFLNIGASTNRKRCVMVVGDNVLIEDNEMSHCEDFTQIFGYRGVVRNNYFHDAYITETSGGSGHIDGFQSSCGAVGGVGNPINFVLFEGNRHFQCPSAEEHTFLVNTTVPPGSACEGGAGSSYMIVRFNQSYLVGDGFMLTDDNDNAGGYVKMYNNTISTVGYGVSGGQPGATAILDGVTHSSVRNNIFYSAAPASDPRCYAQDASGTNDGNYNFAFNTTGTVTWDAPIGTEPNAVLNLDPLFVATTNFTLQSTSPAISSGGYLTLAAGTGVATVTLVVDDASFFQPGWADIEPDWVAVGSYTNVAQIVTSTGINYSTNTITLASPLSWNDNAEVYLYKKSDSVQVLYQNGPDIGAVPYDPGSGGLTITAPLAMPECVQREPFSVTCTASNGTEPYVWTIMTAGTLPVGITLNSSTGVISGRSNDPDTYQFTVVCTDNAAASTSEVYTLTVDAAPLYALSQTLTILRD